MVSGYGALTGMEIYVVYKASENYWVKVVLELCFFLDSQMR